MSKRHEHREFFRCDQCGREREVVKERGTDSAITWYSNRDDSYIDFNPSLNSYRYDKRAERPALPIHLTCRQQDGWDKDKSRMSRLAKHSKAWKEFEFGATEGEFCSRGCAMAWLADQLRGAADWPAQPQGDGE